MITNGIQIAHLPVYGVIHIRFLPKIQHIFQGMSGQASHRFIPMSKRYSVQVFTHLLAVDLVPV